jgi:hypothetical protein
MAAGFAGLLLTAGYTTADLDLLPEGDPEFMAEVKAELRALLAAQEQKAS